MADFSKLQTAAQVPTETAAQYLRAHQLRADVTRSSLTATDPDTRQTLTLDVYAGQVDTAPVLKFLGY